MTRYELRDRADADIRIVVAYLVEGPGKTTADRFLESIREAAVQVVDSPTIGSRRFERETGVDGLRCWPVAGFPHLVLYIFDGSTVIVLRVLHERRDVGTEISP